jgi:hypothetical protein
VSQQGAPLRVQAGHLQRTIVLHHHETCNRRNLSQDRPPPGPHEHEAEVLPLGRAVRFVPMLRAELHNADTCRNILGNPFKYSAHILPTTGLDYFLFMTGMLLLRKILGRSASASVHPTSQVLRPPCWYYGL